MTRVATKELERLVRDAGLRCESPDVLGSGVGPRCICDPCSAKGRLGEFGSEVLDGRRKQAAAEKALEDIVEGGLRVDVDNVSRAQDALDELRKEATK